MTYEYWFNRLKAGNLSEDAAKMHGDWTVDREGRAGMVKLVKALEKIAKHPHNNYDHPANGKGQYGIGVTDGHRCAAQIAEDALAALRAAGGGEK